MSDQDVESRLADLEQQVAKLKTGGSAFRPISPFTAHNPLFVGGKALTHLNMKDRYRRIFIPAQDFTLSSGTPTLAIRGSNLNYAAWNMADGATSAIAATIFLPHDLVNGQVPSDSNEYILVPAALLVDVWITKTVAAGSSTYAVVKVEYLFSSPIGNLNTSMTALSPNNMVAAADLALDGLAFTAQAIAPTASLTTNTWLTIRVTRLGTDGSDDFLGTIGIVGVSIRYRADM